MLEYFKIYKIINYFINSLLLDYTLINLTHRDGLPSFASAINRTTSPSLSKTIFEDRFVLTVVIIFYYDSKAVILNDKSVFA